MSIAANGTCSDIGHIEEDKSLKCASRSSSVSGALSDQTPTFSAIEADISTADSNDVGSFSETDKADGFPGGECQNREHAGSDDSTNPGSGCSGANLTKEAAQQQLEKMSQAVMAAWSTLRALESELGGNTYAPVLATNGLSVETLGEATVQAEQAKNQCPQHNIKLGAVLGAPDAAAKGQQRRAGAGSSSRPDVKGHMIEHAEIILTSAKRVLDSTPGVAGTTVVLGTAQGTIATLLIDITPNAQEATRLSVTAISKAALLEAAVCTQIAYILGYEAAPFQDNVRGFAATLAIVPNTRQFRTCWATFMKGSCPHSGSKCKWWHPGRDEIQPIQVVFR